MSAYAYDMLAFRIGIFVGISSAALLAVRADLAHPFTWFLPLFGIYSLSAPIAYLYERPPAEHLVVSHAVWLELVALAAFIAGHSYSRTPRECTGAVGVPEVKIDALFERLSLCVKPLFLFAFAVTAVFVAYMARTPFGSKQELVRENSFVFKLQFAFSLLLLAWFSLLVARWLRRRHLPLLGWAGAAVWFGGATYLSSERDLLLRFALISVVVVHLFVRRVKVWHLCVLGGLGLALVGLLGLGKVQKVTGRATISASSLVEQTFRGEFFAAADNLVVMLEGFDAGSTEFLFGQTFEDDIQRVFSQSALFGEREALLNGTAWFNRTFFERRYLRGGGRGFSLVAEGYLNFGVAGVAGLFFLLSLGLHWLYRRSSTATGGLLYALVIPGVLYAVRMDVSALLSYSMKQVLLPALAMIVLGGLLDTRSRIRRGASILLPARAG